MTKTSRILLFGATAVGAVVLAVGFQNCSSGFSAAQLSSASAAGGSALSFESAGGPVAGVAYQVSNPAGALTATGSNLVVTASTDASFVLLKTFDPNQVSIQDQASGQCFSASAAGGLTLAPCTLATAQTFVVQAAGDGRASIRSVTTATCLAGASGAIALRGCRADDDQQRWIFAPPSSDLDPLKQLTLTVKPGAVVSGSVPVQGVSGSEWVNVAAYAVVNGAIDLNQKVAADVTPANGTFTLAIDTAKLPNGINTVAVRAFSVPAFQPATDIATKFLVLEVNNAAAPIDPRTLAVVTPLSNATVSGLTRVDLAVGSRWQNVAAYPFVNGQVVGDVKIAMDATPSGGVAHLTLDPSLLMNGVNDVAFVAFDTPAEVPYGERLVLNLRINVNNAAPASALAAGAPVVELVISLGVGQIQLSGQLGSGWTRVSVYPVLSSGTVDVGTKVAGDVTPANGRFTTVIQSALIPPSARGLYIYAYTAGDGSLIRSYQALPILSRDGVPMQ